MTFSMTGYGKSTASFQGKQITVEIRTLNSKQSDVNVRMPSIYREKEIEIRDMISSALIRGKIDLSIQRDIAAEESNPNLNESLIIGYHQSLRQLEEKLGSANKATDAELLSMILGLPEVMKSPSEDLEEEEYKVLSAALSECIKNVQNFRAQEGEKLAEVIAQSSRNIEAAIEQIVPMEDERITRIKQRITGNLNDDSNENSFDKDRFEQELIYYLEKLDITEEKVRLKAHCEYFIKTLESEEFKGKKLGFIGQEMGREINTLGSKAQHSEIQKIVVGMKDELEKIKEQVLNIL